MPFTTRFAFAFSLLILLAMSPAIRPALADNPVAPATASPTPPPPQPNVAPSDVDRALVARVLAAAKIDPGTPGTEAMNFLMNGWPEYTVDILSGKTPATQAQIDSARGTLTDLLNQMELGAALPRLTVAPIPHVSGAITIDGKLDDPGWKNALAYHGNYPFNTTKYQAAPETTVRVTWDEKYLYFAFDCKDSDIIAPPLARDKNPFAYDAVEMFILPTMDPPVYWELVVGPQGAIYDGLHTKDLTHWGTVKQAIPDEANNIEGLLTAETIDRDAVTSKDIGYKVEVAVPFNQLPTYTTGRTPKVGDTLHIMLCRMDKHEKSQDHYAVVPLMSWGHNIWNYIPVRLEGGN